MSIRLGLFFLISTFTHLAFAEPFTKVSENNEANFYILESSIDKKRNIVEFLQITDFKQAKVNQKGETYLSMEYRAAIDCATSSQTMKFVKVYSASMASGTLIANGRMNQTNPIPPGTSLEFIKTFVCR